MAATVLSHHTFELLESVIFNLPADIDKLDDLEVEKRMLSNLRALRVCSLAKPPINDLEAILIRIKTSTENLLDKICPSSSSGKYIFDYLHAAIYIIKCISVG